MTRPPPRRARAVARPTASRPTGGTQARPRPDRWEFRLYVAGTSPRSRAAVSNLTRICEVHLHGRYHIEVIDLLKDPRLAARDQIIALPTLVRTTPAPLRRIIGDLSSTDRVLSGLEIRPAAIAVEDPGA